MVFLKRPLLCPALYFIFFFYVCWIQHQTNRNKYVFIESSWPLNFYMHKTSVVLGVCVLHPQNSTHDERSQEERWWHVYWAADKRLVVGDKFSLVYQMPEAQPGHLISLPSRFLCMRGFVFRWFHVTCLVRGFFRGTQQEYSSKPLLKNIASLNVFWYLNGDVGIFLSPKHFSSVRIS